MSRTNPELVKKILGPDYGPNRYGEEPELEGFIDTASSIVDDLITAADEEGLTISTAKRELIERWLSAHCYVMSDQNFKEKKTERASGKYQGETGMYLEASKYGQMAVTLDSTGLLTSLGKKRLGMVWLGKTEEEQLDYDERN